MGDASYNLTAYQQYEPDAISDSSTDLPYKTTRAKRPWSNDSHTNINEQDDTVMSGDDSLSSGCCSISEMRSLKRLRIEDNQPQFPPFQTREMQNFKNKPSSTSVLRSVSISSNSSVTSSIFAPTNDTSCSTQCAPGANGPSSSFSSLNRVDAISRGAYPHGGRNDRESAPRVVSEEENTAGFGRNIHPPTGKLQESTEEYKGNHLLGSLHMNRRNHQRPTKNATNWKRQVRLQSNSQLF